MQLLSTGDWAAGRPSAPDAGKNIVCCHARSSATICLQLLVVLNSRRGGREWRTPLRQQQQLPLCLQYHTAAGAVAEMAGCVPACDVNAAKVMDVPLPVASCPPAGWLWRDLQLHTTWAETDESL